MEFKISIIMYTAIHSDTLTCLPQPFYGLFPGPPGWAGARRELLDLLVQGKINTGRHWPSSWAPLHPNQPVPTSIIPHTDLSGYWKSSPAVNEDFMFKFHHAAVPRFVLLSKKFIYCLGSIIWNPLPAWNTIHFTSCKTVLQTELSDAAYTP